MTPLYSAFALCHPANAQIVILPIYWYMEQIEDVGLKTPTGPIPAKCEAKQLFALAIICYTKKERNETVVPTVFLQLVAQK